MTMVGIDKATKNWDEVKYVGTCVHNHEEIN